ncbi:flagellar basal body P-ring protein FlgI [Buchnera aphidicola]|uniref:flagellar basal body P-ring protein FlgI n=1 Tax=Buchnera aphidicola TaxID=9 RepID=UPI003463AD33
MIKNFFLKIFLFILIYSIYSNSYAYQIKDLIKVRKMNVQLIGYGIVIGLNGTGDQCFQSPYTKESLDNILKKLNIKISSNINYNTQNTAIVIVTADVPSFTNIGDKINVCVSSIGSAKNLKGGILLTTPLRGLDKRIYAFAQGHLSSYYFNKNKKNYLHFEQFNKGKIIKGATIKKKIRNFFKTKFYILKLKKNTLFTSKKISDLINKKYPNISHSIDDNTIQINYNFNGRLNMKIFNSIREIKLFPKLGYKIFINLDNKIIKFNNNLNISTNKIFNKKILFNVYKKYKKKFFLNNKKYFNKVLYHKAKKYDKFKNIIYKFQNLGIIKKELIKVLKFFKKMQFINCNLKIIKKK